MKKYPDNFQKAVTWLKTSMNIDVQLSQMTCFMGHSSRKIFIHHNYNLEKNGLYALLHELGHALQPEDKTGPNHYKNIDEDDNPKLYNMYQFMNELDAWNRGYEISKLIGVDIDEKIFNKCKEEALLTYYV